MRPTLFFEDDMCATSNAMACLERRVTALGVETEPLIRNAPLNLFDNTDYTVASQHAHDACQLAHYSEMAAFLGKCPFDECGPNRPDPPPGEWVDTLQQLGPYYRPFTTILDAQSLPIYATQGDQNGVPIPADNPWGSQPRNRTSVSCYSNKPNPFGFERWMFGFGILSNFPTDWTPPQERGCPGGDCTLAPMTSLADLSASSSVARIEIRDGGNRWSATTTVRGSVTASRHDCRLDTGTRQCAAELHGATLSLDGFTLRGQTVKSAEILVRHSFDVGLGDTLLAVRTVQGDIHVIMENGDEYVGDIGGDSALLAIWDPEANILQTTFAFTGEFAGLDVTITGNAGGVFANSSPIAQIEIAEEVECTTPLGTAVLFDGRASLDLDGDDLRYTWYDNFAAPGPSTGPVASDPLLLVNASVGPVTRELHVQDPRGRAGSARATVTVVDTTGPELHVVGPSACLWPPNNRRVAVRLGNEIDVAATDACEGDVSSSAKMVAVSSSEGTAATFDDETACLVATRLGSGEGNEYSITVEVSDSHGNTTLQDVVVRVPHDQSDPECHQVGTVEGPPC